MEEFQKTEFRNYLTAGGLLLTAFLMGVVALWNVSSGAISSVMGAEMPMAIIGIVIFIIGILLAVVGKRDLAAISFILTGASTMCFLVGAKSSTFGIIFGALMILWSLILLTSKDRQKIVFFIINLAIGLVSIITAIGTSGFTLIDMIIVFIAIVFSLYFALAAGFEKIHLPGHKLMTEDQDTLFKESGSAIGYTMIAIITGAWTISYLFAAIGNVPIATNIAGILPQLEQILGFVLIVLGILLFAVGKMKFTSVMFMLFGTAGIVVSLSSGLMFYAIGAFIVILGLFAMVRGESRILPGLMLILYGCTFFISVLIGGTTNPVLSLILNGLACLIAVYLSFATMSQKNVPLI